jgi:hypothetical protein
MDKQCMEFCHAMADVSTADLGVAVVDAGHLGNVPELGVIKVRQVLTLKPATTGTFGVGIAVGFSNGPFNDRAAISFTNAPGGLTDITTFATNNGQDGLKGWKTSPWANAPFTAAGLTDDQLTFVPVSGQVKIIPTQQWNLRAGAGIAACFPEGQENAWDDKAYSVCTANFYSYNTNNANNITLNWINPQLTETFFTGSTTFGVNHWDIGWWSEAPGATTATFEVTVTAIYYVYGRLATGLQPPLRISALWSCVRSAYASPEYDEVVEAAPGGQEAAVENETKKFKGLAMRALDTAVEMLESMATSAIGALLLTA